MTELEVSRIAFGTWQIGGEWGEFDEREVVAAIRHARDLGINFFDTAQAYGFGVSERLLGEALRDDLDNRRDEVVIATKGGRRGGRARADLGPARANRRHRRRRGARRGALPGDGGPIAALS